MPLYLGHKNTRGLSVSPALQSLGIDMLRAPPSKVGCIARPLIVQTGYASYISHLPAFLQAYCKQEVIPLDKSGFPTLLPIDMCLPLQPPSLVVDFKGPIPSKHIEDLNEIGFERIRVQRSDNIIRFPSIDYTEARKIRNMNPNQTTPAPVNTVNLQSFESWVLAIRVLSNFLLAHTYPAFTDDEHAVDDFDELTNELGKRKADAILQNSPKRVRQEAGVETNPDEIDLEMEEETETQNIDVVLRKAKPPRKDVRGWGASEAIPNTSGLFFPFVPELSSYDTTTVPDLIERYFVQCLGDKPEHQVDRMDKIRSAWGIIGQTDAGNEIAHLCKIVSLCLTAQARAFPVISDKVYQGCMMSGGRFFVGIHGHVFRPLTFEKLQEEAGSYHLHSTVLLQILGILSGAGNKITQKPGSMRSLRKLLLDSRTTEEQRDEIRRLAVHLHFSNDKFLAMNAQSIQKVIDEIGTPEDGETEELPLHHSALFSQDSLFVALSSFGYQAPSFMIDNCPKISLKSSKPPNTLVIRQKTLELAVVDWKTMLETKEIRNNPRNLSRANRDRSMVGNDKIVLWGRLNEIASEGGGVGVDSSGVGMGNLEIDDDGLDGW